MAKTPRKKKTPKPPEGSTTATIDEILKGKSNPQNNELEVVISDPVETAIALVNRVDSVLSEGEARPQQGKFQQLNDLMNEKLSEAFETQLELSRATINVVNKHTEYKKQLLEAAIENFQKDVNINTNGNPAEEEEPGEE